jgi:hypothetical protein
LIGDAPMPMTPPDFGKLMMKQAEKWGKVIWAADIKLEQDPSRGSEKHERTWLGTRTSSR